MEELFLIPLTGSEKGSWGKFNQILSYQRN